MSATALSTATFQSTIEKGVTLVDFWAPWCGPCKIQLPIVHELADELEGQATIATVNVDEQSDLASQYAVRSIPTLLLFKDGELVDQMVGVNSKDVLKGKISKLAGN
ncbi:thioredoxin [Paenibacillus sp. J22TS3]|uniref:thioredoxin n=1 Tax=Paenibacillus sp. J22TS3 TaxID=2807192 RepID=UPI001B2ED741|nr:thioredoxin [Paenibacillus sp. J22TS3]GIP23154.1 thioredoxin [Paenibacillus sp. J22TS3]